MAKKTKRLVIPNSSAALDLTKGLRNRFEIITEAPEDCANLFFKHNAELALLSPFEYAKKAEFYDMSIFPYASISLTDASKDSLLLFSKGNENITNIAYRKGHIYETYLAKILFAENYNAKPTFKISDESVKKTLEHFDSLLLTGDEGIENSEGEIAGLLLAEEWFLLTGLPYVSYLIVSRTEDVDSDDIAAFKSAFSLKKEDDDEKSEDGLLSAIMSSDEEEVDEDFFDDEEANYSFDFGEEQKSSLNEYFNFLFSHSLIENIPDLNFVE